VNRQRLHFAFLNVGHFLDHLVMLVFASVAALALAREWGMAYADLITYATPGFIAFGIFALPAGWLADRWSREGMMAVFFLGAGLASIATGLARSPVEISIGLFVVGMFAAIYHPVGLALVVGTAKSAGMAIAANGVWGNLGVGSAALVTGVMIETGGWRLAFFLPGVLSLVLGIAYLLAFRAEIVAGRSRATSEAELSDAMPACRSHAPIAPTDLVWRLTMLVLVTTAVSSLIFQSTTFALPKMMEERLAGLFESATAIGAATFVIFAIASLAQLAVGWMLDTIGPRRVFMGAAALQTLSFAVMPGLAGWPAFLVAVVFMLGAFGQIPINDYMIGRMASPERRASIYGVRFVLAFAVLAATLPFVAWVHKGWGFDLLFRILAVAAAIVLVAASMLPRTLPQPAGAKASA